MTLNKDGGFMKQDDAGPDLVFFNWQKGHTLKDYGASFFFDYSAGQDIPVYIIDNGANLNSPVSYTLPFSLSDLTII